MIVNKLVADFTNGLNNAQFLAEVNLSNIAANCINITTDDLACDVHFDATLDAFELITLDDKITAHVAIADIITVDADTFHISNIDNCYSSASKAAFTLVSGVKTDITGWSAAVGSMGGFDITTGVWTCPADGIFTHNMHIDSDLVHTNDKIHIQITDTLDAHKFGISNLISSSNPYTFIGTTGYWLAGQTLKLKLLCDTSDMDISLRMIITMTFSTV